MRQEDFNRLRANQYFLVQELERRGISVSALDIENELIEATLGEHRELLLNIDSSLMSYAASVIASDKPTAKALLMRAGVNVPKGATFCADAAEEALAFAEKLGFPVAVKPALGSQGEDVYTHIEYPSELAQTFRIILSHHGSVRLVVEEHFEGREYRVFVTAKGDYAVLHRDPAHVIGDGKHTIAELVEAENHRRTHPRVNCLCPILLDQGAENLMRKSGRTASCIPNRGEKVYVRGNSNVKTGAMAEDATDIIHPSALRIAFKALAAFPRMPYAGVDLMCKDISQPQTDESYRVIEVNSLPGIGMHINPGRGKSRNTAAMIVDMIFPETLQQKLAA